MSSPSRTNRGRSDSLKDSVRVQWPYKHLWNLLRGESILADDEVILQELRLSYEQIVKGLTQFKLREADLEDETPTTNPSAPNETTPSNAPTATINSTASDKPTEETPAGDKPPADSNAAGTSTTATPSAPPPKDEKQNELKLRKRISVYLDLEETVAWELFCSYMMFEYKGGSTSFEKLLDSPRVSTEFLADLKSYYFNERISVLLCVQALFGHHDDTNHKYNHIFKAFSEWADNHGISDLTENLLKSLDLIRNDNEQVQILHALTLLMHQMPHLALKPFVSAFKGFTPGRKNETILAAEAALMYSTILLPAFEEEWPESIPLLIRQLVTTHGEDLLLNKFCVGAVIAAYVNMCDGDPKVQKILTTSPFPSAQCIPAVTQLARLYTNLPMQLRHNLPTVVLKSLYYALKAIYEKLDPIPRLGSKSDIYDFLVVALEHREIAIRFLTTTQDLMDLVTDAMMIFPVNVKHTLEMWGSMCATAEKPEDACNMLEDCLKLVTCVTEFASESSLGMGMIEGGVYRSQEDATVCGIRIPAGTEAILSDDTTMLTWDLRTPLNNSVWTVLYSTVVRPVLDEISGEQMTFNALHSSTILSEGPEGDNIRALFSFLKRFAKVSTSAPVQLHDLYEPAAYILMKAMEQTTGLEEKAALVADLVEIVSGGEKLGPGAGWTGAYIRSVWPACGVDPNTTVSQLIMGFESVAANHCNVTIAFLDATLACFHDGENGVVFSSEMKMEVALNAVYFINENVFHSFTRWRMESQELKCKVLLRCLRIYNAVFRLQNSSPAWHSLRGICSRLLLMSNSSLMAAFNTDDEQLQNSVIKPTKNNYLTPEIIYESLGLLLNLFKFQKETIQLVDASLGSTLVLKLGRFARHRLDYKIPTLAMALLKKIAEELHMSLLSCFGSDEVAFRDLILQRLEFRSEDVNLKVAILEFLTVAAFNQPGLIQYVFMDDFLAEKIVDLPTEKDEGLALSVLSFLSALVQKGATVVKKCKDLWTNVFTPIHSYQSGGRLRIVTATLQIASIELFRNGLSDAKFASEIKWLLKDKVFMNLYQMLFAAEGYRTGEDGVMCLRAFNHFMSVMLRRNDMSDIFDDQTKLAVMKLVASALFNDSDMESSYQARVLVYVETMSILVSVVDMDKEFVQSLSQYLLLGLPSQPVGVKISLLYLTHELIAKQNDSVGVSATENLIRTMCDLFDRVVQAIRYEPLPAHLHPIVMLAASVTSQIISKGETVFPQWLQIFQARMLSSVIVLAINQGLKWQENADIVSQLVLVLRSLADVNGGAELLYYSNITTGFILPVIKYSDNAINGGDGPWGKVYIMAINIMSQMIYRRRYYFLEDALTIWGVHGAVIWKQLISLSNMSQDCVSIRNPESNFKRMRNLLTFNVVALDAVHAMLPFHQQWKRVSPTSYQHLMIGVFGSLQTAINLLEQPTYLHTVINSITASPARSPHISELQAKLWEVVCICSHILWTVRSHMLDFVVVDQLRLTVNQVTQACVKALSKVPHGARSVAASSGSQNVSNFPSASPRTAMTLERNLALIHYMAVTFFAESSPVPAIQKRLLATDVAMMVDGVKRVSGHTSDSNFCMEILKSLEDMTKKHLNKILNYSDADTDNEILGLTRRMFSILKRRQDMKHISENPPNISQEHPKILQPASHKLWRADQPQPELPHDGSSGTLQERKCSVLQDSNVERDADWDEYFTFSVVTSTPLTPEIDRPRPTIFPR